MRKTFVFFVALVALAVVMSILVLFVPSWATLKAEAGDELSLGARILIASSNFWARYGVFACFAIAGLGVALGLTHLRRRGGS